ncbi:MAG: short chain dehydrogenase [bacterium]|nr:MAG: short chain dehydrogenase [bacterium]
MADTTKGTALITGGAKRLGRAIALKLAGMGYHIALHYNNSLDEAKVLCSEIQALNMDCEIFQSNLLDENALMSLIPRVKERFHDLNLLINNASVFQRAQLLETDFDLFNNNFHLNFKAPFFLTKDFAKHCGEGHIVNMVDAKVAYNDISYSAYTLSKKALADFTMMAAKELAPAIRVNAVGPGYILPPDTDSENYLTKRPEIIPLQRKGEPSEITDAIGFLVQNTYITGQILYVDGGEHL